MYTESPFIVRTEITDCWQGTLDDLCEQAQILATCMSVAGVSFVYQGHTWIIHQDGSGEEYSIVPCRGGTATLSRIRDTKGHISVV